MISPLIVDLGSQMPFSIPENSCHSIIAKSSNDAVPSGKQVTMSGCQLRCPRLRRKSPETLVGQYRIVGTTAGDRDEEAGVDFRSNTSSLDVRVTTTNLCCNMSLKARISPNIKGRHLRRCFTCDGIRIARHFSSNIALPNAMVLIASDGP